MPERIYRTTALYRKPPSNAGFLKRLRDGLNKKLVAWIARYALEGNDNLVLEAGSGSADGASLLASRTDVRLSVALDLDLQSLKVARKRDKKVSLVHGDLFRLPFKPGSLDLVWNNSALEHIHDSRRVIHEMVHVAKNGGRVFVGVPYKHGPFFFQRWMGESKLGRRVGHLFDRENLLIQIEGTGLVLERFVTYYFKAFLGCLARKEETAEDLCEKE